MKIKNKNIWLYADPHFGHKNVIKYCNRPFKTIGEMNTQLIKNFNKVVEHDAIVFILGDFSFLNTESTQQILKAMNGFKYLIKGNHDRKTNSFYRSIGFMEVYDKPILFTYKNLTYILSHEPINTAQGNFINIHGHTHGQTSNLPWSFDISVEMTKYKPIQLETIYNINIANQSEDYNIDLIDQVFEETEIL